MKYLCFIAFLAFVCGGFYFHHGASNAHLARLAQDKREHEKVVEQIDREQVELEYQLLKLREESAHLDRTYGSAKEMVLESLRNRNARQREKEQEERDRQERLAQQQLEKQAALAMKQASELNRALQQEELTLGDLERQKAAMRIRAAGLEAKLSQIPRQMDNDIAQNDRMYHAEANGIDLKLQQELTTKYAKFSRLDRNVVNAQNAANKSKIILRQRADAANLAIRRKGEKEAEAIKESLAEVKDEIDTLDASMAKIRAQIQQQAPRPQQVPAVSSVKTDAAIPPPHFARQTQYGNELEEVVATDASFRKLHTEYLIRNQAYRDMLPMTKVKAGQLESKRLREKERYEGSAALEKERYERQSSLIVTASVFGALISGTLALFLVWNSRSLPYA